MQQTKQSSQLKRSQKKSTAKFSSNSNINDIIKRFETKKVNGISLNSKNQNLLTETTNNKSSKINSKCVMNSKKEQHCLELKHRIQSDHGNMNDLECAVNESGNVENGGDLMQTEQTECDNAIADNCNKSRYESRGVRIRQQLQVFQRIIYLLLNLPFFSSINGAGLSTLTCAFFLPRFLCQTILYPIFRLVFGTLYPAYASYKAVRNKDNKDYVSTTQNQYLLDSLRP